MNNEYLDLKSYIVSYIAERKSRYTKLDKHDKAIDLLINENKELISRIKRALEQLKTANVDIDSVRLCEVIQYAEFILKGE